MDPSVTNISANASGNPQNPALDPGPSNPGFAPVANGVWLDHRLALVHPSQSWIAIADLHYGYELCRRREGHLTPDWGRTTLESRLTDLLRDHQPATLILVGDIMDGTSNVQETLALLTRLQTQVNHLIPIIGNHDHRAFHPGSTFIKNYNQPGFFFHHGHEPLPTNLPPDTVVISGHHHPAVRLKDGAGLRLKLPALIREHLPNSNLEQWILPAFSPWAAGGEYQSPYPRLATWICAPNRVWQYE